MPSHRNISTKNLNKNKRKHIYNIYVKGRTAAKLGVAFKNANSLLNYYPRSIIFTNNSGINKGVILYWPNPKGKKIGLSFGNNTNFQKKYVIPHYANLLKRNNNWYAETSGALEHMLQKYYNVKPITNKNIIRKTLNVNNINNTGAYTRNIPGIGKYKKRLYGHPRVYSKSI